MRASESSSTGVRTRSRHGRSPPAHWDWSLTRTGSPTTPTRSGTRTPFASRDRRRRHITTAEYGDAPYEEFLDRWTADRYEPTEWARLFRAAGADYVIPVTKHHDGVTLWDAPGSGDLTTVARGPRRDLIGPLADAVRAEGIRFGVYYSGGLDWAFTDFPPIEMPDQIDPRTGPSTATTRDMPPRMSETSSTATGHPCSGTTSTGPTRARRTVRSRSSCATTARSCPRGS